MGPHLTHDQIASLVAQRPESADAATLNHLKACPECREALGDSRLYLSLWSAAPDEFADGEKVESANRSFFDAIGAGKRAGEVRTSRRKWTWVVGASAAAAAALAWFVWPGTAAQDFGPVTDAIEQTSVTGLILIPGAENATLEERPVRRSGFAPLTGEVDSTLHAMAEAYTRGTPDADLAVALVGGYLAVGQVGSASDFSRDARSRFPRDARLFVLEGLIHYYDGDFPAAEQNLRAALEESPGDEVATINLASVLVETGRGDEATTLAQGVQEKTKNEVLRVRAERIIETARSLQ